MKIESILFASLTLTLAACATAPDLTMKIEKSPSESEILIGSLSDVSTYETELGV